jgi:hypothetical protein
MIFFRVQVAHYSGSERRPLFGYEIPNLCANDCLIVRPLRVRYETIGASSERASARSRKLSFGIACRRPKERDWERPKKTNQRKGKDDVQDVERRCFFLPCQRLCLQQSICRLGAGSSSGSTHLIWFSHFSFYDTAAPNGRLALWARISFGRLSN